MKELLKKKSVRISLFIILLVVIAGIAGINAQSAQKQKEYNGHIEAAEKYLSELDYEQAIAEYTLALEIEPKSEEVLSGLEQTYLAYAKSYADAGDYERAVEILEEGYAMTERESLKEKIEEYSEKLEAVRQKEEEAAQGEEMKQIVESDEFKEKVQKLDAIFHGTVQYITNEQIKELCWPLIEALEQYRALYPENWMHYHYLPDLYFLAGEYELCVQIRKELHELFPDAAPFSAEFYSEEYRIVRDEYGRYIRCDFFADNQVQEYEYGQNDKKIRMIVTMEAGTSIHEFEYDSEGRPSKVTYLGEWSTGQSDTGETTYEYSEGGFTIYQNSEIRFDNGSYSVYRSTTDYVIDEYGVSEQVGEPYDVYQEYR